MEKGKISVQTENIFPIIKKFLYSDQEIFLRELIANAVDATQKLKTLSRKGDFKGEIGDERIQIMINEEKGQLIIRDRGIGMTADEMKKYLNQVAFSSAHEFLEKYKDESSIIGHFGLGFYSAFMVAEKVEVDSLSYQEGASAAKWVCEGEPSYEILEGERSERGTDIILHIAEDEKEFLKESKVQELLDKYCKFLPIEIEFGTKTETEGEGEDAKEIELPNIVNNPNPAWKKNPADLTDEDYNAFYQELYPYSTPPLFWIHLNIDFPFNLTGILYFPKLNNQLEVQKNKIHLYSNQVYVTDEVKEIVPEFLTLLHGVIDSPDIPLNVSRSYLQSDRNVKKITGYITKKVADKLNELFNEDRKDFETKWNEINVFVKYGMLSEDKFFDKAQKFALYKNTEGSFYTLDEYKALIKDEQTDKNDVLVLIYTTHPDHHTSYIKAAKDKGYDVLVLDTVIDTHFVQMVEQKDPQMRFVRVDSSTADKLIDKGTETEDKLSDKEKEKVQQLFKGILPENQQMKLEALSENDHPVVITKPEFMRRMKEMQQMQGMSMEGLPDMYEVIVNTNHPLVGEKMLRMRSEDKKERFAQYLFDLARLNQNMLQGEELNRFIENSIEMMES
jgi:molecular chaperone HtpG